MKRWGRVVGFIFTVAFGFCQQDTALKRRADKLMSTNMTEAKNLYVQFINRSLSIKNPPYKEIFEA